MDTASTPHPGKPASVVALSTLPQHFVQALQRPAPASAREVTIVSEAPADMPWLDAPDCTQALRAWLKSTPNAHVQVITPDMRTLADTWPRLAEVFKWYSHQVTALAPVMPSGAQLQGVVITDQCVIYQRRDADDWHLLPLARNAVAIGMVERMLAWGAGAAPQSLGTTGLAI